MVIRLLLTSCNIFLFPYLCFADFTGPGVAVLDGNTIEVLHKHPGVGLLIHTSIPLYVRPVLTV